MDRSGHVGPWTSSLRSPLRCTFCTRPAWPMATCAQKRSCSGDGAPRLFGFSGAGPTRPRAGPPAVSSPKPSVSPSPSPPGSRTVQQPAHRTARHHPTALGELTDPLLNRSRRAGQVSHTEKAEVITMGLLDKVRNRFMMSRGRAKQETGRVTRNRSMQTKGMSERISGAARQVAEQAKDAGRNIREAAKH